MRHLRVAAILVVATCELAAQSGAPAGDAMRLVAMFRSGAADRAVAEIAAWPDARVLSEGGVQASADPWALAVLVVLHTEAGLRNGTFGDRIAGLRVLTNSWDEAEARFRQSRAIVWHLLTTARTLHDSRLLEFCRAWTVFAGSFSLWNRSTGIDDMLPNRKSDSSCLRPPSW